MVSGHEDEGLPNRQTLRLQGYDYSQAGAYAVTICTQGGEFLFGHVTDGAMQVNAAGRVVARVWEGLPEHYPHVGLDVFVVMPDHVHGVIVLADVPLTGDEGIEAIRRRRGGPSESTGGRAGRGHAPAKSDVVPRHGLSEVVRGFKSFSARRVNELRGTSGVSVWQRGYYEHVVRNKEDLNRIREYIEGNPVRWWLRQKDREDGLGAGGSG